ncbi:helix-turn-helix transcriptional regulator [Paenibacillus sp. FSL R10-2734]|uniref:helix-turn-helix domain-containing protein n=1 Tax=Paenibacillus sp. FSL R10-2734 TaxID=2954691 RepID=UPI0030D8CB00
MAQTIEENVQRLLDEKGWTIYQLGKKSEVSLTVLYGLGSKRQGPRVETLIKLADTFGVTLDELVRGKGEFGCQPPI